MCLRLCAEVDPPLCNEAFLQEVHGHYAALSVEESDRLMHAHGHTNEEIWVCDVVLVFFCFFFWLPVARCWLLSCACVWFASFCLLFKRRLCSLFLLLPLWCSLPCTSSSPTRVPHTFFAHTHICTHIHTHIIHHVYTSIYSQVVHARSLSLSLACSHTLAHSSS
jgi:hypothetical protein